MTKLTLEEIREKVHQNRISMMKKLFVPCPLNKDIEKEDISRAYKAIQTERDNYEVIRKAYFELIQLYEDNWPDQKPKKKNPWIKVSEGNDPLLADNTVIKRKHPDGSIYLDTYRQFYWFYEYSYQDMSHKYVWDEEKQKIVKSKESLTTECKEKPVKDTPWLSGSSIGNMYWTANNCVVARVGKKEDNYLCMVMQGGLGTYTYDNYGKCIANPEFNIVDKACFADYSLSEIISATEWDKRKAEKEKPVTDCLDDGWIEHNSTSRKSPVEEGTLLSVKRNGWPVSYWIAKNGDEWFNCLAQIERPAIRAYKIIAPASEKWIAWNGGKCPVSGQPNIEIMYRDGDTAEPIIADEPWEWEHEGYDSDIIAYRAIEEKEEEKPTEITGNSIDDLPIGFNYKFVDTRKAKYERVKAKFKEIEDEPGSWSSRVKEKLDYLVEELLGEE